MSTNNQDNNKLDQEAIQNFQKYLRINSAHPNVNYSKCVFFLERLSAQLNLPIKVVYFAVGKPVVIITWQGTQPTSPSLMLNSHMDVYSVNENQWTYKPFNADTDNRGNIYGRGSRDVKSLGIQYLEAIKRLRRNGVELKRTIHVTFVPDEEIGGHDGMKKFVESNLFKWLNVGCVLGKGGPSENDQFFLFYGQKTVWRFNVRCSIDRSGLQNYRKKVQLVVNSILNFRASEQQRLKQNPNLTETDIMRVNLLRMRISRQDSDKSEIMAMLDCHIPNNSVDLKEFQEKLNQWCKEAGEGVWIEYEVKQRAIPSTRLDDSNPYWVAFKTAADELDLRLKTKLSNGPNGAKHTRVIGIATFGFSAVNNCEMLAHDHDEYLNVKTFLKGIHIYCKIIKNMGNIK